MKPYQKYKDSGVEWLGKVPGHWDVKRLKYVSMINPPCPTDVSNDFSCVFIPMEAMNTDGTFDNSIAKPFSELRSGFTYFAENDVIFAKITPCFENGKGALLKNLGSRVGFGSTEFHVLRAIKNWTISEFLYYLTFSSVFRRIGEAFMRGVAGQKRVANDFVQDFSVGVPSIEEQGTIARFLDCKTAQIDNLLAKKERMIELLKEERTAIINQTVTKGLDLNVERKDSGVEWIGKVSGHWDVKRLKYTAKLNMGQSPDSEECNLDGEGTPFLQGNAEFGSIYPTPKMYCPVARKHAHPKDFLLSVRAPVGALNVADQEYGIGRGLCAITPYATRLEHGYAWYLLATVRAELDVVATGSTYEAVSVRQVGDMYCILPSLPEQHSIANYLDHKTAQIDAQIAREQKSIDLLREYRTALISEVEIDVRGEK